MPDIFAGLGFLALLCLVFDARPVSKFGTPALAAVAMFGALMSTGNFLAYAAAATPVILWRRVIGVGAIQTSIPLLALAVATWAIAALPNVILYGRISTNVGSSALIFGRFVEQGFAQDYLHANCATQTYEICAELPLLDSLRGQRDQFLYGDGGRAVKMGIWLDEKSEYARLNRAIILWKLPTFVQSLLQSASSLFISSSLGKSPGDQSWMSYPPTGPVWKNIHNWFSNEAGDFDRSRQQLGEIHVKELNWYYFATQFLSYILTPAMLVLAFIRKNRAILALLVCTIVYVAASDTIHGGLVGLFVRYHVKAVWVLWPVSFIAFCVLHRDWLARRKSVIAYYS